MHNWSIISPHRFALGEGILWDDKNQCLWWTDILAKELWQHCPQTQEERCWRLPQRLGSFALTTNPDILLLALEKQLAWFNTVTEKMEILADIEPHLPHTRANDGRCDRAGNFVFGTLNEGDGGAIAGFYRFHPQKGLTRLNLPACQISNSLCFSSDGTRLYFTDSPLRKIWQVPYDQQTGDIGAADIFYDLAQHPLDQGVADGSIIDAKNQLWNAEWGTGNVHCYSPNGKCLNTLTLPVKQPTCLTIGGPQRNILYVTSAYTGLSDLHHDSLEGAVFRRQLDHSLGLLEPRITYPK